MSAAYIAIDWGTTNRRAFAMSADGQPLDELRDGKGIRGLTAEDYEPAVAEVRARLGPLPIIAAGMIGSKNGWREVPYVEAPAGFDQLAAGLLAIDGNDVSLVPGVATPAADHADVMRGEEVPILGAVAQGTVPPDAQVLKPGTHSKFVTLADGCIVGFRTAMTGEVYALLREHSLLRDMLAEPVTDTQAFRAGVREGRDRDLLSALFGVRAAVLLGRQSVAEASCFASGLLIGDELAARAIQTCVYLLAASPQRELYTAALHELGHETRPIDADRSFLAGIHALWQLHR